MKDLEDWENFKTVLRFYLYVTDRHQLQEPIELSKLEGIVSGAQEANNPSAHDESVCTDHLSVAKVKDDDSKKRRRNRWGVGPSEDTTAVTVLPSISADSTATGDDATTKKKKSRWSVAAEPAAAVGGACSSVISATVPLMSHEALQQTVVLQMQLKHVTEKIATVVQDALAREQDPNRSPSPPPRYDGHGKRTNTREVRMREALTAEKTRIIEDLIKLNPLYQPPVDFVKVKPFKKVYIPIKEHPNYNFIGLIIGPRGNTQRRLEKDTGTKVSIRGKGSIKEGRKNQMKGPDDDDELHVHIQGETEDAVNAAVKLVNELLVPVDDEKNEHKQKQLRELALINGTLREDEFCSVCGERGHKQFECPHRSKTFKAANVKCAICGDQSHPTRDCPLKDSGPTNEVALDSEYNNFMAELDGGAPKNTEMHEKAEVGNEVEQKNINEDADGIVTTERIISGNKKQTIIHSKTLMTGWGMVSAAPIMASTNISWNTAGIGSAPSSGGVGDTSWYAQYGNNAGINSAMNYSGFPYGGQAQYVYPQQYYDPAALYYSANQVLGSANSSDACNYGNEIAAQPPQPTVAGIPPPPPPI